MASVTQAPARSSSPLLPLRLIADRVPGLVYSAMLSISASVFGMFFFINQYAQNSPRYSPLRTGVAFLPLTGAIFGLSLVMSRVPARTGARLPLLCGTTAIAASLIWLSQTSASQGYPSGMFGPLLPFGIGVGLSVLSMSATILGGASNHDTTAASEMYQAMQQIGGSLGLAIVITIAGGHDQAVALEVGGAFAILAFVFAAMTFAGHGGQHEQQEPEKTDAIPLLRSAR